jgi:hypothetical protein
MWRGYISCGQVKYFSKISYLTPPNIPGLKGRGINLYNKLLLIKFNIKKIQ